MQSDTSSSSSSLTPAERLIAPLLPSIRDVFFIGLLFGGVFAVQGRALGIDGDAGWTLRLGQIILAHGLPRAEPLLSQGPGQAPGLPLGGWLDWEWLAQVAYALAYRLGGLNGLVALAALLVTYTLSSLLTILRRHGASLWLAMALTVAALPLVALIWSARAQLFSLPLALWWGEWLWRYWRDGNARRWLWRFPLALALWANLHGGFLWGLMLLGLATALAWALTLTQHWRAQLALSSVHASPRALTLAFGASLLATLATPWGFALPIHVLGFAQNPLITQYTQEYQSPNFHLFGEQVFLLLLFLLIGVWLWAAARPTGQPDPLGLTICGAWTLLTFLYVRSMSVWPLLTLPYLVDALVALAKARLAATHTKTSDQSAPSSAPKRSSWASVSHLLRRAEATDAQVGRAGLWRLAALLVLIVLLLGGGRLPGMSHPALDARFDAQAFPVAAVAHLRTTGLPPGRGFNTYEWGGYLEVALPGYHPFIDSRSDSYSEAFLHDYLTIISLAPGWQRLLDTYAIAWALLPSGVPLAQVLAQEATWRCQPADSQGVATLCVRRHAIAASWGAGAYSHAIFTLRRDKAPPLQRYMLGEGWIFR